jgi:hypothetical protein
MEYVVHHIIDSLDGDALLAKKYFSPPTSSSPERKIIISFAIMFLISWMIFFIWHNSYVSIPS